MTTSPTPAKKTHTITISDVAYGGRGIARKKRQVIFVPNTLAGETVEVEITTRHKRYSEARLIRILEPSPHRVAPACPLAADGSCPGCVYQHADYAEELRIKASQLDQQLQRICEQAPPTTLPPVGSPHALGYRNKLVLHAYRKRGRFRLGYVGHDNHQIIDIAACPLASEAINRTLTAIRHDEKAVYRLRHEDRLTIRETAADGVLSWPTPKPAAPLPEWLSEATPFGKIEIPRTSFSQVNPAVSLALQESVSAIVREAAPQVLYDLYCGVGLFALAALHDGVPSVIGIDSDGRAITAARRNAATYGFEQRATFHGCAMEEAIELLARDGEETQRLAIVDPPRTGVAAPALEALIRMAPQEIVYVSCAADTMARDAQALLSANYRIVSTQLFDMFPRTRHFESVTRFQRDS
jgi:23S rRNA (uracil1939-C5)-methyltransferase